MKSTKWIQVLISNVSSTSEYPLPMSFTGIDRCLKYGPWFMMSITACTCLGLSSGIMIPFHCAVMRAAPQIFCRLRKLNMVRITNTNAISHLSLRGAERRSNPMKNEIAAPFGLAMTPCDVKIFNAFVLVIRYGFQYTLFLTFWEVRAYMFKRYFIGPTQIIKNCMD